VIRSSWIAASIIACSVGPATRSALPLQPSPQSDCWVPFRSRAARDQSPRPEASRSFDRTSRGRASPRRWHAFSASKPPWNDKTVRVPDKCIPPCACTFVLCCE
jgi:hypothetical protein